MLGNNNAGAEKSVEPKSRNRREADTRTYSLESIMGLQKALENGINLEKIMRSKAPLPHRPMNHQNISTNPIQRLHKSLAAKLAGLGQTMRLVLTRKKQFRRTSAR